ncbi:MAG: hypothetical protein HWE25_05375 [Alphaproteobacteria bacterium]|nr:hypothetical protein [Alphaproteobacteria bacterium]
MPVHPVMTAPPPTLPPVFHTVSTSGQLTIPLRTAFFLELATIAAREKQAVPTSKSAAPANRLPAYIPNSILASASAGAPQAKSPGSNHKKKKKQDPEKLLGMLLR